jgi:hypothetical protein
MYEGRKERNNVVESGTLEVEGAEERFGSRDMSDI